MPLSCPFLRVTIGEEHFRAQLLHDVAPESCKRLAALLAYRGELLHARWSGEACWSPLAAVWPAGSILAPENATNCPMPGQVLLYGGELSEPELLIAYGECRFASKAGPLAGNPVMQLDEGVARLSELGRRILRHGALELRITILQETPGCAAGELQR